MADREARPLTRGIVSVPASAPLVSVIIPTYDRAGFVGDALASVVAQAYDPLEVIVVDDGSTDGTADVVAACERPVRWIQQEHRGVSAARNRGLAEARGELIAFLDSDDVWTEGSLRHRVAFLTDHPEAAAVHGKTRVRNLTAGTTLRRYADGEAVQHPCFGSMLVRRSAFAAVGMIDETFAHSEDVDWLCRAKEKGIVIIQTDHVVLEYRIHGGNMTSEVAENRAFLFRALKQSLDRRRRGAS